MHSLLHKFFTQNLLKRNVIIHKYFISFVIMAIRYFSIFITISTILILIVYNKTGKQSIYLNDYKACKFTNEENLPNMSNNCTSIRSFAYHIFFENRMKSRREYMKKKCAQYGLDIPGPDKLHTPNAWEFLVNRKYHIIWCNIFKAASSSWMYNFNLMAGYSRSFVKTHKGSLLSYSRRRYRRVSVKELRLAQRDSITFMIARDPFERLLSAFIDKFQHPVPKSPHEDLCFDIVKDYRENTTDRSSSKYPTFNEFTRWHLDQIRENREIDMHLVSANLFCLPCLMRFDMILKFETLAEDQNYLIQKAWLEDIIEPLWENKSKAGNQTKSILKNYYSQLNVQQLQGLYDYYKYDFEVFGYSPSMYMEWVKDANKKQYESNFYSEDTQPFRITM